MADFVAVIRRAVNGLSNNAPEDRERVYEKARTAIRRQLESMKPPAPPDVVRSQLGKLEAAIKTVEAEQSDGEPPAPAESEDRPPGRTQRSVRQDTPVASSDADPPGKTAASVASGAPKKAGAKPPPPRSDTLKSDAEPSGNNRRQQAPSRWVDEPSLTDDEEQTGNGRDNAPLVGEAHDALFGLNEEQPDAPERPRRSRGRLAIVLGVVVALLLAGAYGVWNNRDTLLAGLWSASDGGDSASSAGASAPAGESAGTAPDRGEAGSDKFTQRLLADGTEVDAGLPPDEDAGGAEGRTVAGQTEPPANRPDVEAPGETADVTDAADGAPQEAVSEAVDNGQAMYLYEERLGQLGPAAVEGSVVWRIESEPGTGEGPPQPAIHGEISVPERNLTALLTIKRNTDPSLPASHLIEIVFALPGDFDGGGIEAVQRMTFKQTEEDRGDALIAVPAKITDDFFMIALNDFDEAVETNVSLMRERNWIDIPLAYSNGRRALITLEKGASGTQVFERALNAWAARSGAEAGSQ